MGSAICTAVCAQTENDLAGVYTKWPGGWAGITVNLR